MATNEGNPKPVLSMAPLSSTMIFCNDGSSPSQSKCSTTVELGPPKTIAHWAFRSQFQNGTVAGPSGSCLVTVPTMETFT